MEYSKYIWPELFDKFEFESYGHALEILNEAFPQEWNEIQECLSKFSISREEIRTSGGMQPSWKFDDVIYELEGELG